MCYRIYDRVLRRLHTNPVDASDMLFLIRPEEAPSSMFFAAARNERGAAGRVSSRGTNRALVVATVQLKVR